MKNSALELDLKNFELVVYSRLCIVLLLVLFALLQG